MKRKEEMERVLNGGQNLIDPSNFQQTLRNCKGLYNCPVDEVGRPQGPLVGYAGTYKETESELAITEVPGRAGPLLNPPGEKHYVGLAYYNFSAADQYPAVLRHTAKLLAEQVSKALGDQLPDVILGAPMAGIKLSAALAEELGCRHIFAEKRILQVGQKGQRDEEEMQLGRYDIHPGERVLIGEELVNKISSAAQLIEMIEKADAKYVGISCAINRSEDGLTTYHDQQIMSVLHVPTPSYRQDNPIVEDALGRGLKIIWKPKNEWAQLKAAMDSASQSTPNWIGENGQM